MTDRPIIFSAPMVRALLGGRKTMTRRLAWHQEPAQMQGGGEVEYFDGKPSPWCRVQPGDRLWVRENIWQASHYPGTLPSGEPEPLAWCCGNLAYYVADGDPPNTPNRHYPSGLRNGAFSAPDPYACWLKRPSIHMERRFSRLTLTVTAVKRERLQAIDETDAKAEGVYARQVGRLSDGEPVNSYRAGFLHLWNELHGDGAWQSDPEIVALSFTVALRNIDAKEAA